MRKILFCITFLLFAQKSQAQEFFGDLLSPSSAKWTVRAGAENARPESQQKVFIQAPIFSQPQNSLSATWKWSQQNLESGEKLNTGGELPTHLYNSEFGLGYKHFENLNHFWGFHSSVGSAGDQIFHSRTKTVWNVTAFYSTTEDPTSRWVWLLNDSNNRTFLNQIPLPGFAYIYRPSEDFLGIFGFPFIWIRWKMNEVWNSQFFLGPYIYKAEVSRPLQNPLQLFLAADHTVQAYYREDRLEEEDRIFYTEARFLVGLRSPIHQMITAEAFAGFVFNRSVIEEKNYSGYSSDELNLKNRGLVGLQLNARF